ncbi:pilus assembly protein TadG-related protein [Aliiroseovarius crassostreae]|uniref:pilus assembly protein TadG-related protein n=1 Tax=Aliiroseovarius crassostreae TaxID=154981 RepID=UPI0022063911|nr:pilus assembly protein TadG-related protein [Aliiroseovarius crassostreae]UWP87850.1 hypothetical protein K3J57_07800 [Aliiroseovarius crassostreae]UWQ00470.1 hypothetical protein K3X44_07870 [Aliiroseovarius crassostreae]
MRFLKDTDGYVLVLTLLFLPVFLGMAVLVIDISRGNNAHSDLQAAADALALAGAVELDGGSDAITRAKAAMENVDNTVHFLGNDANNMQTVLEYEDVADNEFTVIFLRDIPPNDHDPIDQAWVDANFTTDGTDAEYVYVSARSEDLYSIFSSVLKPLIRTVPVRANAVAMSQSAVCDVPPLFICNPFEGEGITDLQTAFSNGLLHGRILKLHAKQNQNDPAGPGNFGFLQTNGTSSAADIRDFFAGARNPTCYESDTVDTKPGYATSIATGFNIRFDLYDAPYKNAQDVYGPAYNVRKGYEPGTGNFCRKQELVDPSTADFMGFPDNGTMGSPTNGAGGVLVGSPNDYGTFTTPAGPGTWDEWDISTYWSVNHPSNPTGHTVVESTFDHLGLQPSRYDVYRHEIETELASANNLVAENSTGGETGYPKCSDPDNNLDHVPAYDPADPSAPTGTKDRRVIIAAIVNCLANPFNGQATLPVNSYASIFMVRPIEKSSNNGKGNQDEDATLREGGTIDVEFVDITGFGGNGTLDTFIRAESILVR